MNQSTPISMQNKIKFLKYSMDQLQMKVTDAQSYENQNTQQVLRIKFLMFLDESIHQIQKVQSASDQNYKSINAPIKQETQQKANYKQKYYEAEKQKIDLQKKLMQLRQRHIKQQQHGLKLEKMESQNTSTRYRLQDEIRKLNVTIKQLKDEMHYQTEKIKHQEQQMQRLIRLNQRQNQEVQMANQERSRAEKQLYELQQKHRNDQSGGHPANSKLQKFSYKNTEGLRNVRVLTNISGDKKNHEKYFILELPVKIQLQKIVYGIRIGTVLPNKEIFYFNELFLYEKDPLKIYLQGVNLVLEYLKRKQRIILDKYKITRPQILVMLYGKGDSVMVDQTKEAS